jgi:hypothetical protein
MNPSSLPMSYLMKPRLLGPLVSLLYYILSDVSQTSFKDCQTQFHIPVSDFIALGPHVIFGGFAFGPYASNHAICKRDLSLLPE